MGNRRRILLLSALVVAAFAGAILWEVVRPPPPEPSFEGKPLSVWRDLLVSRTNAGPALTFLLGSITIAPGAYTNIQTATGSNVIVRTYGSGASTGAITITSTPSGTRILTGTGATAVSGPNTSAFKDLGTNAAPILLAILETTTDNPVKAFYRAVWPKMPPAVQKRWPQPPDMGAVRTNAAQLLTELGDTRYKINLYRTQKSAFVRRHVIVAVAFYAHVKDPEATRVLVDALGDRDAVVRQKAALGLAVYSRDKSVVTAPLLKSLHDSDPLVRLHSAMALSDIPEGREVALPEIIKGTASKNTFVSSQAFRVLKDRYPEAAAKNKPK